jgi:S1-C subfamily serine protease
MFLRVLVVLLWIFTLPQATSAQAMPRKKTAPTQAPVTGVDKVPSIENAGVKVAWRRPEAHGWVWVSHTIDLAQKLGGEDNIMTLDGEPLPIMRKPMVTLGLVIDNEGHIVTRLVDATLANPPMNISIRAPGGRPTPAQFLGMDAVTGLCVLKAEGASLSPPSFPNLPALPKQLYIRLYGFNPQLNQNVSGITSLYPRCDVYPGQIAKAVEDFRFNADNPIYNLLTPQLTLVQDCSLILDKDDSVFGVAIYNIAGEGKHIVYPVSRLQTIAQSVIKSHTSITYGWLGATGQDAQLSAITRASKPQAPAYVGVQILNIAPDSPAEKAGVKPDDIVVAVNDRKILNYEQMVSLMKQISPDNEVSLRVKRGNEYKLLRARLISAPAIGPEQEFVAFNRKLNDIEKELDSLPPADPNRTHLENRKDAWQKFVNGLVDGIWNQAPPDVRLRVLYGFEIQPLTIQLMSHFAVINGLLVSNVNENTVAARSGLQAGDVILKAGPKSITRLAELIDALDSTSGPSIEFTIVRSRERLKITFQR